MVKMVCQVRDFILVTDVCFSGSACAIVLGLMHSVEHSQCWTVMMCQ